MATSGKAKSGSKTSSARRVRGAPRSFGQPKPPLPWYKTTRGRMWLILGGVVVLVTAIVAFALLRGGGEEETTTGTAASDEMDEFTLTIEEQVLAQLQPPATEMTKLVAAEEIPKDFDEKLIEIQEQLDTVQTNFNEANAPLTASTARAVLGDAIGLYSDAATILAQAAPTTPEEIEATRKAAARMIARAGSVWFTAVSALDDARDEVGLGGSNLGSPVDPTALVPQDTGGGNKGKGNKNEDGGGKGKDGSKEDSGKGSGKSSEDSND